VWNVTSTVFSPWVWVRFPRNSPEGAGFYLELEKGLKRLYFIISLWLSNIFTTWTWIILGLREQKNNRIVSII